MKAQLKSNRGLSVGIFLSGAIILALGLGFFLLRGGKKVPPEFPRNYPEQLGRAAPCPGKTVKIILNEKYLPGILSRGQESEVTWNWYACNAPKTGEVALMRISRDLPPQPKLILAVSGDKIAVRKDKSGVRWNLLVNGKLVLDHQNVPYFFGGEPLPQIGRFIQTNGPVLGPDHVIALSTRSPGDMDSGIFGVMGVSDLVAKVSPSHRHH